MKLIILLVFAACLSAQTTSYVACGNPNNYVDSTGTLWAADNGSNCTGGTTFHTTSSISGTPDPTLYQYGRAGTNLSVTAALPIGFYTVVLKFADTLGIKQVGQQVFNITINGTNQLSNFDIFNTVRQPMAAYDVVVPYFSNGTGTVTVAVNQVHGMAQLQAVGMFMQVLQPSSGGFPNPMLSQGDLIIGGLNGLPTRVPAGTSTFCFVSNGIGQIPSWQTCPGGGGGGANPPFNTVTSGTNSTATMTVGTGGSIVPTGSGVISATQAATTPSICTAGQAPTGILPNFNATGCTTYIDQTSQQTLTNKSWVNPFCNNEPCSTAYQFSGDNTTVQYNLVKVFRGSGTFAITSASTSDTDGILGVCQYGCGTAGSQGIVQDGTILCNFDGATTSGDYIVPSNTAAGKCKDAGSVRPTGTQNVGIVLQTLGSAGQAFIQVNPNGAAGTSGGGGAVSIQQDGNPVGSATALNIQTGLGMSNTVSMVGSVANIQHSVNNAVVLTKATNQAGASLLCASLSASGTTYTCAMSPTLTVYTAGGVLHWQPDVNSTGGATTLNVDTLGAKSIKLNDCSSNPASGTFTASSYYDLTYNGTVFCLVGSAATSGSAFSAITSGTNVSATMTAGTGSTITFSGSGINNANQVTGVAVSGTAAANQTIITSGAAAAAWGTVPNAALTNSSITVNSNTCALGGSCTVSGATNTQTGNYTMVTSDTGKTVIMNCSANCTLTLPASPTNGFYASVLNISNSATLTISLNGKNFNGSASVPVLVKFTPWHIWSDGTNYFGSAPPSPGAGITFTAATNSLTIAATGSTTVSSGTATLGTSAIASAACATAVTVSATGVATTDTISAGFNGDPTAVTGYIPATAGMLTIIPYPTANNVNFKVCNNTASSITPGAITLNWRVVR